MKKLKNFLKVSSANNTTEACECVGWSRRGGVRYQEGEVETRWQGLNLDVSWGAVVNLAQRQLSQGGRASKAQVQKMVSKLLGVDIKNAHATDAAAVAIAGLLHKNISV